MKRAEEIGVERYNEEQMEKSRHLEMLLENYNDGRKKTFYCQAVNLLTPVSYTHLDVYKRQSLGHGGRQAYQAGVGEYP